MPGDFQGWCPCGSIVLRWTQGDMVPHMVIAGSRIHTVQPRTLEASKQGWLGGVRMQQLLVPAISESFAKASDQEGQPMGICRRCMYVSPAELQDGHVCALGMLWGHQS